MEELINQFHFLRPVWLWGLAAVALVSVFLFLNTRKQESWRSAISKEILPFLVIKGDRVSRFPKFVLLFLLLLMIIALAGPSWKKVEKPGGQIEAALVLVVDASRSMLAEDIKPSRMERAKQKINDLLNASPGAHTAVVVYAGTSHLLIPFTTDYKTILYQIESVSPAIMPVQGTNLGSALELADSLLAAIEAPNTIVIFTDDASDKDIEVLKKYNDTQNNFEYLALGTTGGAPVPLGGGRFLKDDNGNTVVPGLNIENLKKLGAQENVNISTLTLDASDVKRLALNIRRNLSFSKTPDDDDTDWQDAGYWLIIPIALLTLFWFRRGWVLNYSWLLLFGLLFGSCTSLNDNDGRKIEPLPENWTFTDLWYTRDQQGQRLLDKGEAPEALDKFEDPRQKAMILYHLDSLEDASAILTTIPSAESYFNQGVIQAQLKNWSSSKTAFEKAIDIKPDFKEAKENLDIILAIIEERKSRYVAPTSMEDKLYGRSEENQELQDMEGEMEETEGGKKEENAESAVSQSAPPQQDNILSGEMPQEQQQEEKDMVLRQLSDDPAEFLKRKFQHQVLTGKVKKTTLKEKW